MNQFRYNSFKLAIILAVLCFAVGCKTKQQNQEISFWLTNPDKSVLFQEQKINMAFSDSSVSGLVIDVDPSKSFQEMDGFGFTLTGGSAQVINRMEPAKRKELLNELFGTEGANIGISYLRLSIGASDLNDHVFSYNDLPAGETDTSMSKFSLEPDRKDLLPVLKEILAINPDIKILGSPWSPPVWMKTNKNSKGGSLMPQYYDVYAKYFIKYIQSMKAEGIRIDAITIQNEPLHPGNNPSLLMLAPDQATFIKKNLGPAFKAAGIDTKIILYDHNADRPDYPISILNDPEAKKYVDGSAFHLYGGHIDSLSKVHDAHPDKNLYFTEQWIGAPGNFPEDLKWHVKTLIIGAPRNWSRTVLEWNLAADPKQDPHTEGGCYECLGAITVDGDSFVRNPAYYIVAHASKFVRPGSVRIHSSLPEKLSNVAFQTPDKKTVLIVLNDGPSDQSFSIRYNGKAFTSSLKPGAVGTYVW
ncbi:glucosylceramidase [Flavihumibacter sp. R14]|nr:glucosylceramidase [Flavihumibacter soli]